MLEAKRLKSQGVVPGIPDLHLPIARGEYIGLWIEMKSPKGRLSVPQKQIIKSLRMNRNLVEVCYTAESAVSAIENYLKIETEK